MYDFIVLYIVRKYYSTEFKKTSRTKQYIYMYLQVIRNKI